MKRIHIVRDYSDYARDCGFDKTEHDLFRGYLSLKTKMYNDAIRNNGIFKTFRDSGKYHDLILDYIKIEDTDIELYPDMFGKRTNYEHISNFEYIYLHDQTYQSILSSCLAFAKTHEIDDKLNAKFEEIRKACVEKYNGIYSSVEILSVNVDKNDNISIPYTYYYIKDEFIDKLNSNDVIFGESPLPYDEWINLGSDFTDSPRKENIVLSNDIEKSLKGKVKLDIDCSCPDWPKRNTYYSENALKEAKENSNMKIHLLIVPAGMDEEFVNNTKKYLQNADGTALYVSSNDIAFESNDEYKTKYDLLEYWVKSSNIHCVEFMVGYDSDPEAKAFEAFIRGFLFNNSASVDTFNLLYQKDIIENVIDNLRCDYQSSYEVKNKLNNVTDNIMYKVRFFKDFGLEDGDIAKIRNADCDRDACDTTIYKLTEIAFASDKKGSKGNKK